MENTFMYTSPFTYDEYSIVCTNEKYAISEGIMNQKMKNKNFDPYGIVDIVYQYPLITRFQIEYMLTINNRTKIKDRLVVKHAMASLVKNGALLRYYMINTQVTEVPDEDIMDELDESHKRFKRTVFFYTVAPGVFVYLKFLESSLYSKEEASLILTPRDPVRTLRCLCINTFLSTYLKKFPTTKVFTHVPEYPLFPYHGFGCDIVCINTSSSFKVLHIFGVRKNPGYKEELKNNLQQYIQFVNKNPVQDIPNLLFIGEDPEHLFSISKVVKDCLASHKHFDGKDFYNYDMRMVSKENSDSLLTVYGGNNLGLVNVL